MSKKQSKLNRDKKRKNKKKNKIKKDMDLFEKITGINKDTNSYYALKDVGEYKKFFDRINAAFNTIKQEKGDVSEEARDKALNFITRKVIINDYIHKPFLKDLEKKLKQKRS